MNHYDAIVLGTGGMGSAALFHLASRGVHALGIDRFPPGHDRGSSHGQTRIIRQAYFEHPDYVPLLMRAYELWQALETRRGERLCFETGLLQIGPADGHVVRGVRDSAHQHHLEIEELTSQQVAARWNGLRVDESHSAVFERRAGYLLVERCVRAHAEEAQRSGAELRIGETVLRWHVEGPTVVVRTDRDAYRTDRLIITAGPWAGPLLGELGMGLQVLRKSVFWLRTATDRYRADRGFPAFLFEMPDGVFYGVPQIDAAGVKVAEHTGGTAVADPLEVDRDVNPREQERVVTFAATHLPTLMRDCTRHSVCLYTMSPDQNFIIDRHPHHEQVVFAAGFSGHGFKFASVLGEALAQLALDGRTQSSIGFLSCRREALRH